MNFLTFISKSLGIAVLLISVVTLSQCRPKMDKDYSSKILSKIDAAVEDLDLDNNQEAKYRDIRKRMEADLTKGYESRMSGLRKIKSEFSKETPDVKDLSTSIKQELTERNYLVLRSPDIFLEFYNILNGSQKVKVKEYILENLDDINM